MKIINDSQSIITKLQSNYISVNYELINTQAQHSDSITDHIASLFKNTEVDHENINSSTTQIMILQQQLKDIENAIALLNFKIALYNNIAKEIELSAAKQYYEELLSAFDEKLEGFHKDFEKLKSAAILAMPNASFNETTTLNYGRDKNPKYYDERRIHKKIHEIIFKISHFPSSQYQKNLHPAILKSLDSNDDTIPLYQMIDKNFEYSIATSV